MDPAGNVANIPAASRSHDRATTLAETRPVRSTQSLPLVVLTALGSAFAIEVASRLIHALTEVHPLLTEGMSMMALVLLCAPALYFIFLLEKVLLLKWCIVLASVLLFASQAVNMLEDIEGFRTWWAFTSEAGWHNVVEGIMLLSGIILILATFYLALIETVAAKSALLIEQAELHREIQEHMRTQAQLNESRDRFRDLSAHLESVREDERAMVAREIHDELGQTLTALKIDLANLERRLAKTGTDVQDTCGELIRTMSVQINSTMAVVRRMIGELRPGILDDLGLAAALEWQAREFQRRTDVACEVKVDPDAVDLDKERCTALFRVVQEALTNVARHAGASSVTISLEMNDGVAILEVVDDGRGIEGDPLEHSGSFGILGIRERAEQLGGALRIESEAGRGTRLRVRIPIERGQDGRGGST